MNMFFELDNLIGVKIERSPNSDLFIVSFDVVSKYEKPKIYNIEFDGLLYS